MPLISTHRDIPVPIRVCRPLSSVVSDGVVAATEGRLPALHLAYKALAYSWLPRVINRVLLNGCQARASDGCCCCCRWPARQKPRSSFSVVITTILFSAQYIYIYIFVLVRSSQLGTYTIVSPKRAHRCGDCLGPHFHRWPHWCSQSWGFIRG